MNENEAYQMYQDVQNVSRPIQFRPFAPKRLPPLSPTALRSKERSSKVLFFLKTPVTAQGPRGCCPGAGGDSPRPARVTMASAPMLLFLSSVRPGHRKIAGYTRIYQDDMWMWSSQSAKTCTDDLYLRLSGSIYGLESIRV